jgi:uncharacterized OsmC-like protein
MTMTAPSSIREYEVEARSTDVFGRVLCRARQHNFVIDGPVQNGCPGEEVTPVEAFLASVAACCVELLHVIAQERGARLDRVAARVRGLVDRSRQPRSDYTLFNTVELDIQTWGADGATAAALVEAFKRR